MMLKRVSRNRSLVGRVPAPRGAVSWRERYVPAMTRIAPLSGLDGCCHTVRIQYRHARTEFPCGPFRRGRSADPRVLSVAAGHGHGWRGSNEGEPDAHAGALGLAA